MKTAEKRHVFHDDRGGEELSRRELDMLRIWATFIGWVAAGASPPPYGKRFIIIVGVDIYDDPQ